MKQNLFDSSIFQDCKELEGVWRAQYKGSNLWHMYKFADNAYIFCGQICGISYSSMDYLNEKFAELN
jgi:hypothetical protein